MHDTTMPMPPTFISLQINNLRAMAASAIIIIINTMGASTLLRCLLFSCFALTFVYSKTDSSDTSALNVMYSGMNSPSTLSGWKSSGGDPCGDSWKGVTCSGSKVTEIDLSDMDLTGSLGYKLNDLKSVTRFDLSKNKFQGSIPYQLPPNLQHLDLSRSGFGNNVPYSISEMKNLQELNLNNNKLNGQVGDMFVKLSKLTTMDLSSNSLTGDLPQSFRNLTSLSTLNLQNNQLTGSINVLRDLPLDNLNVADNKFTGWIPNELKNINSIKTGGNSWSSGRAPPPPPGYHPKTRNEKNSNKSSGLSGGAIAGIVFSVLLVLVLVIFLFARKRSSPPPSHFLQDDSQNRPFTSIAFRDQHEHDDIKPESRAESRLDFRELESFKTSPSFRAKSLTSSASIRIKPPPSLKSFNNNEYTNPVNLKRNTSVHAAPYSLSDLQTATGNFATGRLLGEGTIGRVYRAKYADGKVLAVKKIESSLFQGGKKATEFTEITSVISKLEHPNICELVGYCSEQGQNMLVCEYFRNGSLHEFLHLSDAFSRPLTWNTRVRIALGTARALEYLHEVCSPPCIHKGIKSSNILLDTELNPCLADCGLAIFYERRSHEKVIGDGYEAPECKEGGINNYGAKSDVFSFGVVMLELMTGRMPMDDRKPRFEQSLVRWATPQLHDIDALEKMADPGLHGLYPPKSLSRFADVVALCVQAEPEFRPAMSEVVQTLGRLVTQPGDDLSTSRRTNDSDY